MVASRQALEAPPLLGKFELGEFLGDGFFGVRQQARAAERPTSTSGTHALGTAMRLVPAIASSERRAARLVYAGASEVIERLAQAATEVRHAVHPALLTPLQIVRERGRLGVITGDPEGLTLTELMERAEARERALPSAVVLRIVLDVLAGLHALEAAVGAAGAGTCLYGGLTPDSIHVGRDGQTRVIDPGVMAAAARQHTWADEPHMLAYSAPETHDHGARHDVRGDTFAIGILLWELLSCRSLFAGESAHETIVAVCHEPIARVQRTGFVRGEPISATLADVIARALCRDPELRFQSYGELAVALRDAEAAASAEQVATFVALSDAAPSVPSFGPDEPETTRLPRIERSDETTKVPLDAPQLTAAALDAEEAPLDAGEHEIEQIEDHDLELVLDEAEPEPELAQLEPKPDLAQLEPKPAFAQLERVQAAAALQGRSRTWWLLGAVVLVALAAFALLAHEHASGTRPSMHRDAPTPAAAPLAPSPTPLPGHDDAPRVEPPAPEAAQQAPSASAPESATPTTPSVKARTGTSHKARKTPFIPSDI